MLLSHDYLSGLVQGQEAAFGLSSVDDIEGAACVVILGESGLGKTNVLQRLCKQRNEQASGQGAWINLAVVSGLSDLKTALEGARDPWPASQEAPVLYLDGLEHSSRAPRIGEMLEQLLQPLPQRPQLRLAVRSGAWTGLHERALKRLYGEGLKIHELMVLSRRDVRMAFEAYGKEPDSLLPKLEAAGAAPLLARPVTCMMIAGLAAENRLPSPLTRRTLYREAMHRLVESAQKPDHALPVPVALAVAGRAAVATVFGNQQRFRTDGAVGDGTSPHDLATHEPEPLGDGRNHQQTTVRDVLTVLERTGLFAQDGAGAVRWAHASFADYLAAEYLARHQVPLQQVRALLGLGHGAGPLVTAVEGVAAWLAADSKELWGELVHVDPLACLDGDPAGITDDMRAALVDAIFSGLEDASIDRLWFVSSRLAALAHPGLADQVRTRLGAGSERVQSEVIHLASVCKLTELCSDLLALALSEQAALQVRVAAAHAVLDMGSDADKLGLRPLLAASAADTHDDLFGVALQAMWPDSLSAAELFALLRPPRAENYAGAYARFLMDLRNTITKPEVLLEAVQWARVQDVSRTYEWNAHLVDAVVGHIKHRHDDPALVAALADIVQSRARAHRSLINLRSDADNVWSDEMRRAVFLELLARGEQAEEKTGRAGRVVASSCYTSPPLFDVARDTLWALREVEQVSEEPHTWIALVSRLRFFMVEQSDAAFDALYAAAEKWPALKESCRGLFESPIGGEEGDRARAAREAHAEQEESFRREAAQVNLEQKLRVEAFLAGDLTHAEWIADNFKEPSGKESWLPLGTTHAQLEAAMVLAVTSGGLGVGHGPRALHWALSLVYEREQLDQVPARLWRDIAGSLSDEVPSEQDLAQCIGEKIWACAREELLTTLRGLPAHRIPYVMSRLERLFAKPWPRELLGALHELTCRVPPDHGVLILDKILAMDPVAGVPLARSIAEQGDAATRQYALSLMVRFADRDTRLHLASTLFTPESDEGRSVVELIAVRCANSGQLDLSLDELVSLAIWIRREYPREPDPLLEGVKFAGPAFYVHRFLERVLAFVFSSEDEATLAQIQRLTEAFPEDEWLRHRAHGTRQRLALAPWQPLALPTLFRFVRDRQLRIVRTVEDLFEVVGESLSRFQDDLRGGRVDRLWNTKPVNPKDEETLSDELGRFLAQDLTMQRIIAVREVQVRPSPRGLGRKVDVYLSTFGSTAEPITVLIEVKRCVHKSWDDVEGELIARYFDHHHRHGWYVVGHYNDGCSVCSRLTLEKANAHIQDRIAKIQGDYVVRGVVLDCRWETAASAKKAAKRSHRRGGK